MTLLKDGALRIFRESLRPLRRRREAAAPPPFREPSARPLFSMGVPAHSRQKRSRGYEEELRRFFALSEDLRKNLVNAVDVDAAAYGMVMEAFALPKQTDEEKAVRREAIQKAFGKPANRRGKTSLWCLDVLRLCARVSGKVNVQRGQRSRRGGQPGPGRA